MLSNNSTLLIKHDFKSYKEKMKKTYFAPEVEIVDLKMTGILCASVPGGEGGGDDGGSSTVVTDPTDPGWGSDY